MSSLSRNVGNVEFDQYGGIMVVDGKTGQRRLRLTACVGDLQAWINVHPMKENPNAPLFITYHKCGFGDKRLSSQTVRNRLCGIGRKCSCYKAHQSSCVPTCTCNGFSENRVY